MDDKELQAKRAEAKAAGYSDEEIDGFLKPVAGPGITAGGTKTDTPFANRGEEMIGTAQAGAVASAGKIGELAIDAAKYALPAYGIYKGGQALANRMPGPPAGVPTTVPTPTAAPMAAPMAAPTPPAGPTTFTGGANPAFDKALSRPYNPGMPQGAPAAPQPPTAGNFIERMSGLAQRYATTAGEVASRALPAARAMTGVGAALYSSGLNTGENEMLARIRQAQAAGQPMPQVPYQGQ